MKNKVAPISDAHKIEALTPKEQREIALEMTELAMASAKKQLKIIQEKREAEELTARSVRTDQVDIDAVDTILSVKHGGLPDYIAALPKTHIIRLLWEEGYRVGSDGLLCKAVEASHASKFAVRKERSEADQKKMFFWGTVILLEIVLLFGFIVYNKSLVKVREEIVTVVKRKGLPEGDTATMNTYRNMRDIYWLPDLKELLAAINLIPFNFDRFSDNEESGSYMEHIERHDEPFDAHDAMDWRVQTVRKPHTQPSKQPIKEIKEANTEH